MRSQCMLERTAGEVHATACWQHFRGHDSPMTQHVSEEPHAVAEAAQYQGRASCARDLPLDGVALESQYANK